MNAIIALCHFCEYHGPSVLFCTQAFHCEEHDPLSNTSLPLSNCGSCVKRCFTRSISVSDGNSHSSSSSRCDACYSLDPTHQGYISIDQEAHISYYSNRNPGQQELYSIVRQACVRSLSCEVCPGREGPMFFGEEASGYVFTHTFFLKDKQSRGFQRWYSIICVMKDRIYLINSWPFLVSHFKELIVELQVKATAVYETEQAEAVSKGQAMPSGGNGFVLTPDQFRRQRGGHKVYRSIAVLLEDQDIFARLHQKFSWILKACGNRITERLLEGPPKEELLLDLDAQTQQVESALGEVSDLEKTEDQAAPLFHSLRHMMKILGKDKFHLLAYHVIQGNQLIVRGEDRHIVSSALNTLKDLIPSGCVSCVSYSNVYKDSWRCNFLGLSPEVEIPAHVLSSELFVLLDVISSSPSQPSNDKEGEEKRKEDEFRNYSFSVCGKENSQIPTILQKVEHCLDNENVSDRVFRQMLICLKEEWMDKVKVVFKFAKSRPTSSEDKEKLLRVLGTRPEDEIVLKFWMTGLNQQYRSHLLTCSSSGSTTPPPTV
ncbi:folliculin [Nematostella vectensis]|uniref:folliculin n=1 Tax=Nematostella vectensis TaxID=45351 RepID=UPI0013902E92|nr:folliculin [Nematostella vectensis]